MLHMALAISLLVAFFWITVFVMAGGLVLLILRTVFFGFLDASIVVEDKIKLWAGRARGAMKSITAKRPAK